MLAIQMGKGVYCQKPLTHTVAEARALRMAAREHKVATQMGNQGTSENGLRRGVEIVQSGAIGKVSEIHVFNRHQSPHTHLNKELLASRFLVHWTYLRHPNIPTTPAPPQ